MLSSLADFEARPRSTFVAESVSPLVPQDRLCVLQNAYTFLYDNEFMDWGDVTGYWYMMVKERDIVQNL